MKLSFYWRREAGEAIMSKVDADRLRKMAKDKGQWITAADFAKDVLLQATALYEEVMAAARDAKGGKP